MWYILTWLNSAPVWAEIILLMCPINFQFPRQLTWLTERERRKMPIKIWIFNLSILLRFMYTHLNILQHIWNVIRYAYVFISIFKYLYISDYVYFGSADLNTVRQVCFLRLCGNLFPLLLWFFFVFCCLLLIENVLCVSFMSLAFKSSQNQLQILSWHQPCWCWRQQEGRAGRQGKPKRSSSLLALVSKPQQNNKIPK